MSEINIGDVVPGCQVPSGAMVLEPRGAYQDYAVRVADSGWYVGGRVRDKIDPVGCWNAFGAYHNDSDPQLCEGWRWDLRDEVTIVALNLTGQETAADLWALAKARK